MTYACSLSTFPIVLAILIGNVPYVAAGDAEVVIPSDQVARAILGGLGTYKSHAELQPDNRAYLKFILEYYRLFPNASPDRVAQHIERARTILSDTYRRGDPDPPNLPGFSGRRFDWFNAAADLLDSIPIADNFGLGLTVSYVRQVKELAVYQYHREMEPVYRVFSLLRQGAQIEAERLDDHRAFDELHSMSKDNPLVAETFRRVFGYGPEDALQHLLEYDELSTNSAIQAIQGLMNEDGQIVVSVDQLRAIFGAELGILQETVDNNLSLLQDLAVSQDVLFRYMTDLEKQNLNKERIAREHEAYEYERKLKAANASVYILSTLVGFSDPDLGHQMQVVGESTVQIANAIHGFAAADALGSVILAGNALGAVMSVVSLFSDSGLDPDQQILDGIGRLQQQVAQLRVEMHERFDRVDAALAELFTTMNEQFDRIDTKLGVLVGDVSDIQQTLYTVQSDLYRLERKLFSFLDAGFRRDFSEALNGYIGFEETYGDPIPWSSYVFAENKFHTWAVLNSLDELSTPMSGRSYDDSALYAELSSVPLEGNLNFLDQYLRSKGWPHFSSIRLANPRDWAAAAYAWMELAAESPMFFQRVSSSRLEQIYGIGEDLERAFTNISLVQNDPRSPVANRALFDALFTNYRAKAASFKEELQLQESEYLRSLSADPDKQEQLLALDLWGTTEQSFGLVPTFVSIEGGEDTNGASATLELPVDWEAEALFPKLASFASFLGLGDLELRHLDFEFVDSVALNSAVHKYYERACGTEGGREVGRFSISIVGYCGTFPMFETVFESMDRYAQYRDNVLFFTPPPEVIVAADQDYCEIEPWTWDQALDNLWHGGYRAEPIRTIFAPGDWLWPGIRTLQGVTVRGVDSMRVREGIDALRAKVDMELRKLQRGSYSSVIGELRSATSLAQAGRELSGAKALLESMLVLGFPASIERDDFLRSLVFGGERILDEEAVIEVCNLGIASSFDLSQNEKLDVASMLDERVNALEVWVSTRLNEIEETGPERLRLVASVVSRLDAFRTGWNQLNSMGLFRRGDGNDDGVIDISDPVFNLEVQFLGEHDPGCLAALDTNADGAMDLSDPIYNLEHQFLGRPAPPAPYPDCGPESLPIEEALACEQQPESCP